MKKGTYQIRKASGGLREVQAWEFDLLGIGPLIVTKDPDFSNLWSVVEPRTGAFFTARHKTRKAAIQVATDIVHVEEFVNKERFEREVRRYLERYDPDHTDYYKKLQEEEESARSNNNETR